MLSVNITSSNNKTDLQIVINCDYPLPVKQASGMNREMEKIIMPKDGGKKYFPLYTFHS